MTTYTLSIDGHEFPLAAKTKAEAVHVAKLLKLDPDFSEILYEVDGTRRTVLYENGMP